MGLDCNQLEVVKESGSAKDRRSAAIILPVRKQGNLLLCTLLLGNVGVNSLMAIRTCHVATCCSAFRLASGRVCTHACAQLCDSRPLCMQ